MKEKIKNFLLKIKNFFNEKHSFRLIELIVLCILLNLLTMALCYGELMAKDYCFNETHIEAVEEIPQTESIRIEKDLKFANPTQSDYIKPSVIYSTIYCNYSLSDTDLFTELLSFYYNNDSLFLNIDTDVYIYPLYCFIEYGNSSPYLMYILVHSNITGARDYEINIITSDVSDFNPIGFYFASFGNSDFSEVQISVPLNIYIPTSSTYSSITPLSSLPYNGIDIPIGSQNQQLFNVFSSVPFEISSQPTLENAPSSLVNTIPSNAVTTLPSNLGTKVYDSGSGLTMTDGGNEYNTFGFQIYYESTIKTNETELYQFTIDGVTYNVEPYVYRYYLNDINIVIYTLWNNTPIYYVFENVSLKKQFPFTLDYDTRFNFSDLSNVFASSVYIVNTYNDYVHINIEFGYYMSLNHSGDDVFLVDTEETGLEALIYSSTHSGNYGDKGFDLDIIPQLDFNYSKMGQSQTDNMYSTIVHGGTINSVWSNAYNKGLDVGNASGYTNGYNDGVETGKTLQNPINPIMDFISDGASVISNVFSFEILPNISLGTMLLFPLAIALIWFVIKLFMGG